MQCPRFFLALAAAALVSTRLEAQSCAHAASPTNPISREDADRDAQLAIEGAQRLSSDFDKCRTLAIAVDRARSVTSANLLFAASTGVRGEFERAEILVASATRGLLEARTAPAFFAAAEGIKADFQLRRVLSAALRAQPAAPSVRTAVLRLAGTIEQDYELATLLIDVAAAGDISGDLRADYIAAARTLQSDWEYGRAMQALAAQGSRGPSSNRQ